jgi:hypothetical protein
MPAVLPASLRLQPLEKTLELLLALLAFNYSFPKICSLLFYPFLKIMMMY